MPDMPPFPKSRVSQSTPFSSTGLDYLGPLITKSNGENSKRWICLFTCLVTRAIHLEVINDMTTEEFLYAFRRFISARGTPSTIISDNATQFKLGSETLKSVWNHVIKSEDVQNFTMNKGLCWKFITELAPWMGGFYERLVGVVKRSLRKSLNKRLITDVQMRTIIKEIEAVVNSRPLIYVGEDINSKITLTPSHFLMLNPTTGIPDVDFDLDDPDYSPLESSKEKLLKAWKKGQKLLDSFWNLWRNEYLLSLRERTQTKLKSCRVQSSFLPQIGDVVLIKDNLPRSTWRMGKIVKLISSNDGEIRSAKVQVSTGLILGRPLNLLYPLELDCHTENKEVKKFDKDQVSIARPKRLSAEIAKKKIKSILQAISTSF
ncbi:Hypothetical predicted protein [Mytilus galloprovincialis]|uniref:Integrase catalytic domain-containing protein n=1 Tax=Mytilus galloprovincialis TaxID=29158 RepID=A0A8B6DB23_MYTGA|nr:Hypothetical predicted protein [Mytilus galloprovincialis]